MLRTSQQAARVPSYEKHTCQPCRIGVNEKCIFLITLSCSGSSDHLRRERHNICTHSLSWGRGHRGALPAASLHCQGRYLDAAQILQPTATFALHMWWQQYRHRSCQEQVLIACVLQNAGRENGGVRPTLWQQQVCCAAQTQHRKGDKQCRRKA